MKLDKANIEKIASDAVMASLSKQVQAEIVAQQKTVDVIVKGVVHGYVNTPVFKAKLKKAVLSDINRVLEGCDGLEDAIGEKAYQHIWDEVQRHIVSRVRIR